LIAEKHHMDSAVVITVKLAFTWSPGNVERTWFAENDCHAHAR
jgi:hypothetical protein